MGAGGVINTAIVMAAAAGIVSSHVTKLSPHGGYVNITKTWAKSNHTPLLTPARESDYRCHPRIDRLLYVMKS